MWIIDEHGLLIEPTPASRNEALAVARAELLAAGVDAWDVDEALSAPHVRVERVWWSETVGFAHPNHDDARQVVMVLGLTRPTAQDPS